VAGGIFPSMMEKRASLRVLVVDDELLIRWSVAQTLAEAGHSVMEAADGKEALHLLRHERVDVVLLDYRLPDSNDLALLATIRRLAPSSAVVMMTAHGTPDVTRRALELGAYDVVDKPFDMSDIEPMLLSAVAATR
jgi:two-component system, NtrC family, response regulator AtoC